MLHDNWIARNQNQAEGELLTPPQPMPALVWRWLVSRGIRNTDDLKKIISPSLKEMRTPFSMKDMEKACLRLKLALERGESVCVYGDYDLDGSTGIALLFSGLRKLGFKTLSFYQPSRFREGYGIHAEALRNLKEKGVGVVVSVDCGITAIDEARVAREIGLDLIVTDHHTPREELPDCVAVINPNRLDDDSGLGHLSGVGVGFYLLMGLRNLLSSKADLKSELDLLALGTIADMVPLIEENKVLVKHGLKILETTERPGLRALIQALDLLGRELTSTDVAFSIAPKLNALARLELDIRPLDLLMCDDPLKAKNLAQRVLELNAQRKTLQSEMEEKALKLLDEKLALNPPCVVLGIDDGHPGVVGLVATKILGLTQKPAFVVAFPPGDSMGVGSARSAQEGHHVTQALEKTSEFLDKFGGHAQAAGFSVDRSRFKEMERCLIEHFESDLTQSPQARQLIYDTEGFVYEINNQVLEWLQLAEPFGVHNPTPSFLIKEGVVSKVKWLKGEHLKLSLRGSDGGREIEALAFFAKGKFEVQAGEVIDLVASPSWNYWQGDKRLQLQIHDLRPSCLNPSI